MTLAKDIQEIIRSEVGFVLCLKTQNRLAQRIAGSLKVMMTWQKGDEYSTPIIVCKED